MSVLLAYLAVLQATRLEPHQIVGRRDIAKLSKRVIPQLAKDQTVRFLALLEAVASLVTAINHFWESLSFNYVLYVASLFLALRGYRNRTQKEGSQ